MLITTLFILDPKVVSLNSAEHVAGFGLILLQCLNPLGHSSLNSLSHFNIKLLVKRVSKWNNTSIPNQMVNGSNSRCDWLSFGSQPHFEIAGDLHFD